MDSIREVVSPQTYPPEIMKRIKGGSNLLISIANRWMLGWPERVKTLLDKDEFWEALKSQEEKELDVLVEGGYGNPLAAWEINQLAGLDPAPPVP
ncbi:MAG: hypothetical protein LBG78_01670 [Azoarcus sp.]|jgi:hypothetical protein|nr:hypothetical protein [Azoarcus sp.]